MTFLPSRDRKYLESKSFAFEEIVDGCNKGIVLPKFRLPAQKYNANQVDVLIILPPGYPDVAPDMFYLEPWIKLVQGNRYPKAANNPFSFSGRSWQRWSRHNNEWRRGVDGIWTMLKRIEYALEVAA
ncbi:E2/UBC family protein [Coleofasciculus sp.]|uniref:E2/UBC family protein n=1 Tax=Coleofasciculus sp. TaxID=3100458 RepID=UPI0039FB5729